MKRLLCAAAAAVIVAAPVATAVAHARSESYSEWQLAGDAVTGTVTVASGELAALVAAGNPRSLDRLLVDALAGEVRVLAGDRACRVDRAASLQAARGFVRAEIAFDCDGGDPTAIEYRVLFDVAPGHVNYARIHSGGRAPAEVLFTDRNDRWQRGASAAPLRHSVGAFFGLGTRHIAGGIDHVAFLLGMLLVAGSIGRSVVAVTGFTLGHSVSLVAAVLGYVSAESRLVEAFIGFTVALVAAEYFLVRRPEQRAVPAVAALAAWATGLAAWRLDLLPARAAIAYLGLGAFACCYLLGSARVPAAGSRHGGAVLFVATACFGLVHGFGFAGFLMQAGIRGTSLFAPLLGFNLGVEAGQLALVGAAFVAGSVISRNGMRLASPLVAASLCGLGLYWFIGRSLAA